MKKIVFIIFIMFFISGCSLKYEININDEYLIEDMITIYGNTNDDLGITLNNEEKLKELIKGYIIDTDYKYTNFNINLENYSFTLKDSFSNFDDFLIKSGSMQAYMGTKMEILENGNLEYSFNNFVVRLPDKDYAKLDLTEFENIDFVLTSSYQVVSSNADSVDGNKYIWYLDGKNLKEVKFEIYKEKVLPKKSVGEKLKEKIPKYYFYAFGVIVFIFLIRFLSKMSNANRM